MMARKNYTSQFKHEAAGLVLKHGYSVSQACEAMPVGQTAMRRWVTQLRQERCVIVQAFAGSIVYQ